VSLSLIFLNRSGKSGLTLIVLCVALYYPGKLSWAIIEKS